VETNELFNQPDLKSEDFGELLNELANDLQKFYADKYTDFTGTNGLEDTRGFIEDIFNGNPPIKFLEDLLAYYNNKKRELESNTIPTLLKSMGLTNATTKNGIEINLKSELSFPALSKMEFNTKQMFFQWLESHGAGDLIKDNVQLGKGEFDQALEDFLEEKGYSYDRNSDIHYQTLKAFLGKIIDGRRKGENLQLPPEHILKVETFDIAKIKNKGETNG
jgi:hypothetical protein